LGKVILGFLLSKVWKWLVAILARLWPRLAG